MGAKGASQLVFYRGGLAMIKKRNRFRKRAVIIVFTAKTISRLIREGGTSSWVLDPIRAAKCKYAICTRNAEAKPDSENEWGIGPEKHRSAFLIGRVKDVILSPGYKDRHLVRFSKFALLDIPDLWKKYEGKVKRPPRSSIRYTYLEDTGINPKDLKWKKMPRPYTIRESSYLSSSEMAELQRRRETALAEEEFYRVSPKVRKAISRLHNRLSNHFCKWLSNKKGIIPIQEQKNIDVRFQTNKKSIIAELKVCSGVESRKSIREAIGQLFEYNYYSSRKPANEWLIILDKLPSGNDLKFIECLRRKRSLPLKLGWKTSRGFSFHPKWP